MPTEKSFGGFTDAVEKTREDIERNKYNEFGAERIEAFHQQLGTIIKENVDFDEETGKATLKPKAQNVVWMGVSARDLSRVNKEGSHFAGDHYLRRAVGVSQNTASENYPQVDKLRVFQKLGADFIGTAIVAEGKELDDLTKSIENQKVEYGNMLEPSGLSTGVLTLTEALEYYNQKVEEDGNLHTKSDIFDRKALAENITRVLTCKLEYKKLLDSANDYVKNNETLDQDPAYFQKYIGYQFKKTSLENHDDLLKASEPQIEATCFALAYNRAFEGQEVQPKMLEKIAAKAAANAEVLRLFEEAALYQPDIVERNLQTDAPPEILRVFMDKEKELYTTSETKFYRRLSADIDSLNEKSVDEFTAKDFGKVQQLIDFLEKHGDLQDIDPEGKKLYKKMVTDAIMEEPKQTTLDWTQGFLELAGNIREGFVQKRDTLTGLRNKEEFYKEIDKWANDPEIDGNYELISVDLGFLKYFNQIGSRETGDLAIQKAGWILDASTRYLETQDYKVEVFRTGGDEFQILIARKKGQAPQDAKQDALTTISLTSGTRTDKSEPLFENPDEAHRMLYGIFGRVSTIPRAPDAKVTYVEEDLAFDYGSASFTEARTILRGLMTENADDSVMFSDTDRQILERGLNNQNLDPKEKEYYLGTITEIQRRLADTTTESFKKKRRFEILFNKFEQAWNDKNGGAWREEEGPNPEAKTWQKFTDLLAFSGKTMEGKDITHFRRAHDLIRTKYGKTISQLTDLEMDAFTDEFYEDETAQDTLKTLSRDFLARKLMG